MLGVFEPLHKISFGIFRIQIANMDIKKIIFSLLGLLILFNGFSQAVLSPRIANYDIQVELDTEQRKIYGQQTLFWKNPSTDTIYELQYHLYHNAFKNSKTTFMREENFDLLDRGEEACNWSYVEVQKIVDEFGNDLAEGMEYIQPDDGNPYDQTVLRVPLVQPVPPNGSIKVDLDWETKIPKIRPRTGYNKAYYFMVQWFPKVGVYEPAGMRYATKGQWSCHQYHATGEYYSDFGNYKVAINVPENYQVGASGVLKNEKVEANRKTYTYEVEDVIDFAWTASPHFIEKKTKWKNVDIRYLAYPEHEHLAERFFTAIKNSMEYLDQHVGEYPYPTLTIVNPPFHGIFSSGMEYPTLVTTLSFCFLPEGVKTIETIAVHEFIHQYFMQMVATNEQEEPWMDEGLTTYYEGKILDHYYGEKTSTIDFLGIKVGNVEYNRIEFFNMENPKIANNSYFARDFKHGGYGPISYNKAAIWLRTLEGLVGEATMEKIMKTYFERWKFDHPCARDFISVVNEVTWEDHGDRYGENMNWFFDQVLYGSELCDYELGEIRYINDQKLAGYYEDFETCEARTSEDDRPEITTSAIAYRRGEVIMPIEVLIEFKDGTTVLEQWDGVARSKEFIYPGKEIVCAELDPSAKIHIDQNFLNNGMTIKSQDTTIQKYFTQFMGWVQHTMQSMSMLI